MIIIGNLKLYCLGVRKELTKILKIINNNINYINVKSKNSAIVTLNY